MALPVLFPSWPGDMRCVRQKHAVHSEMTAESIDTKHVKSSIQKNTFLALEKKH